MPLIFIFGFVNDVDKWI